MLALLRRLFAPELARLRADLDSIAARLRVVEGERMEMVTEWVKTRDQCLRYMKRAGALRGRIEKLQEPDPDDEDEPEDDTDFLVAKLRGRL